MKHILTFILSLLLVTSCKDSLDHTPIITLEKEELIFSNKAYCQVIKINSNINDLEFNIPDSSKWITGTLKNTDEGLKKLYITVNENFNQKERSSVILIGSNGISKKLKITQQGIGPSILLDPKKMTVSMKDTIFSVKVIANTEFQIISKNTEWLTAVKVDASPNIIPIKVLANESGIERTGQIIFFSPNNEKIADTLTVIQKGIPEYNPSTIAKDTKIIPSSGVSSNFQPGTDINLSFDGNKNTIYHSRWDNSSANYYPITLDYNFTNVPQIDYVIYYPRHDSMNGNFKLVEVWYNTTDNNTFIKSGEYNFEGIAASSTVAFKNGIKNPKTIRFIVKSGSGDGQGFASCSEMEFYKLNTESSDLSSIFTSNLCESLKPGVTLDQIQKIDNELYRQIALHMYYGKYESEYRIQEYKAYPSPDIIAAQNRMSPYGYLDNITGIYTDGPEDIVVIVGETHGQRISLLQQDLRYGNGGYQYSLYEGTNKIHLSSSGLLYIVYQTSNSNALPIKIHIPSGKVNGYYDISKNDPSQWLTLINKAKFAVFDLKGSHVQLCFGTDYLKKNTNNGDELTRLYDKIVYLEDELAGMVKYNRRFSSRLFCHVTYDKDAYMYATSNRTAYGVGTQPGILNETVLTKDPWG